MCGYGAFRAASRFVMGCGSSSSVIIEFSETPNPLQPVARITTGVLCGGEKGHICVVDKRTALVAGGKGLAVLDIADPANVTCVAKVHTGGTLQRGTNGRFALIPNSQIALVTAQDGLSVVDFSDPPNTKVLKTFKKTPVEWESGRLTIVDAETALVVGQLGVGVLDISNPQNVELLVNKVKTGVLSRAPSGQPSRGGRITIIPNSKVALVTGGNGLCVLDVSDPPKPKVLKVFKTKEIRVFDAYIGGRATIVDAQTALVAGNRGVAVLDIADPQNVQILSWVDPKVVAYGEPKPGRPIILGTRALVVGEKGLAVVDFADRANVQTVAKLDPGICRYPGARARFKLMADGQHVLMTGGLGAAIVDISDLSAPFQVGDTIKTGMLSNDMAHGQSPAPPIGGRIFPFKESVIIAGGRSFIDEGGGGLVGAIGIKDLANPEVMKPVKLEGAVGPLTAVGNMHFLVAGFLGVDVVKMAPAGGAA